MTKQLTNKAHRIALMSSIVYFVLQILDLYLTYQVTPDLHREANILIARFDLGWGYMITSAILASMIMVAGQFWVWNNMVERFPSSNQGYRAFYHHLLYDKQASSRRHVKHDIKGIIVSITLIVLYGLIAAKFLVVIWNALVFLFAIRVEDFIQFILIKNALSGVFGLYIFFIYLYLLHKKQ